jgi:adenine-specific DNA-methyltransferase
MSSAASSFSTASSFSALSVELTKSLSKTVKKEQGIFFTPPTIVAKLVQESLRVKTPKTVLEPSCGSGEFIRYMDTAFSGLQIDAVEQNTEIFQSVSTSLAVTRNAIRWEHCDFLRFSPPDNRKYDWIVGNPPYAVVGKDVVPEKYAPYMVGRPNIFGLFIVHSMSMLAQDGLLAFIVPKSFLNAGYYANVRNYMKREGHIRNIIDFEKDGGFLETQQSTIGIIYQKTGNVPKPTECAYSLCIGDNYVFSENADELRELFAGSTTLKRLGLSVKTGNIVWNQKKPLLTDDTSKTLLLYNSNISKENTIRLMDFKNDEKKQYICIDGTRDMVIVVNRGNGNSAYNHTYAFVDGSTPYLAENHLNVIYSETLVGQDKRVLFESVLRSFQNPKTEQFIRTFLGNNGLSKTELETIFPIFV